MTDRIDIALAADGKYFDPLFVTATSMAAYCRTPEAELRFNILDGGIAADDWALLKRKVLELHPRSSFNRLPVDQERFVAFPIWNSNRMAYARLLLPEALPDVQWVLYSDCDFLWLRDVAELWREREDSATVVAVRDSGAWEGKEKVWFARNGYRIEEGQYFCSGMCLFNLTRFRSEGLVSKAADVLTKHPDVPYVDQTALNVACAGGIKLIDSKWMCFTHLLTPERHRLPSVIHHAGEVPWRFIRRTQPLSDTMLLWHRFNARMRGTSVWVSLRRYFSPMQILGHRAITWLIRFPLTRMGIGFACKVTRHEGVYHFLKIAAVRYDLTNAEEMRCE